MTIIFHLEKFASHGKNKTLHIVSSLYLLIVALIAGPWAALKFKTVKISKSFDVRFRENRIKFMKQETILKAKRQNKGMEFSEIEGRQTGEENLEVKFQRRGMKKKTDFNMMMRMAINKQDSANELENLENMPQDNDDSTPHIMCVTCDVREADCMLMQCYHSVYCQFCAIEIMNSKDSNCRLCKKIIEEVYVLERDKKKGELMILDKIKPKKVENSVQVEKRRSVYEVKLDQKQKRKHQQDQNDFSNSAKGGK